MHNVVQKLGKMFSKYNAKCSLEIMQIVVGAEWIGWSKTNEKCSQEWMKSTTVQNVE